MKRLFLAVAIIATIGACSADQTTGPSKIMSDVKAPSAVVSTSCRPNGDNIGYNFEAMIYRGPADGADFTWDCMYLGNSTIARDWLIINWGSEYVRFYNEGGSNPPYYQACYSNQWNGMMAGGSGQSSSITLCWSPTCDSWINQPWGNGMCSGPFEIVAWHGRIDHERFVIVKPYRVHP